MQRKNQYRGIARLHLTHTETRLRMSAQMDDFDHIAAKVALLHRGVSRRGWEGRACARANRSVIAFPVSSLRLFQVLDHCLFVAHPIAFAIGAHGVSRRLSDFRLFTTSNYVALHGAAQGSTGNTQCLSSCPSVATVGILIDDLR